MSKITVARAITARLAKRFVRIGDIIAFAIVGTLLVGTWALAYFFSPWWWVLLLPILLFVGIFAIMRLIIAIIVSRIHIDKLTKQQSRALDSFTDKVQQIIEARATPLPIIVIICIKDILFHRDVTTIRKNIGDSVSLRKDYESLEKLF